MDEPEPIPGSSGGSAEGQRTSRQEVGPGRELARAGVFFARQQEKHQGTSHPDRDAQFHHINSTCKAFEQNGHPIISVDCKKKELPGNVKNGGREWQAKGEQINVNVYDFLSLADGKAIPYGISDLVHKRGFVNVGIDHETAEFAVERIRRW